jgi:dUTPase
VIGFAAETDHVEEHARAKLARKGCDWIIANDVTEPGVMGGDENAVLLITKDKIERWDAGRQGQVARRSLTDRHRPRLTGMRPGKSATGGPFIGPPMSAIPAGLAIRFKRWEGLPTCRFRLRHRARRASTCGRHVPEDAPIVLKPGARCMAPTGPRPSPCRLGFEMQVRPRSGLAFKNGVTVPQCARHHRQRLSRPGLRDADQSGRRGLHHPPGRPHRPGVIAPVVQASWGLTTSLDETARGAGGFGSTGAGPATSPSSRRNRPRRRRRPATTPGGASRAGRGRP